MAELTLVSGATGFLGSYVVCDLLKKNKKVRALRRNGSSLTEFDVVCKTNNISAQDLKNLEWFHADLLDLGDLEAAFDGVDEVFHCAAIISFLPGDKNKMYRVNTMGTANMVNLALTFGINKFGYISSIAAIGRSETEHHVNERTKWEPSHANSGYAETKYAAEMEVWRGIQEGLNAVIVNPGIIIGVGDFTKGSNKLIENSFNGFPFYTPGVNGFVDVRDVSRSILQLMEQNIFNERFILVAENYPYRQFCDEAAFFFNKKKPRFNTPRWASVLGYRSLALISFFTRKPPLITKETAYNAYEKYYYDNSKIRTTLNFEFIPIRSTIEWACSNYSESNHSSQ